MSNPPSALNFLRFIAMVALLRLSWVSYLAVQVYRRAPEEIWDYVTPSWIAWALIHLSLLVSSFFVTHRKEWARKLLMWSAIVALIFLSVELTYFEYWPVEEGSFAENMKLVLPDLVVACVGVVFYGYVMIFANGVGIRAYCAPTPDEPTESEE